MQDKHKTKKELIQELEGLRRRLAELEKSVSPDFDKTTSCQEQELTLRAISNNLLSGMIYQVVRKKDGTRSFTYLSNTVRRFYGVTPEEGLANADLIYSQVHKDDRDRVFQEEEEAHRTLSPFRSVVRVRNPQGKIRWSSFVSHPRRLADGSTCWDGIEFDITDRKLAEEALRESEEKFSKIFKTSPDAIAIARTSDGVYIDVNESYSQVSGYSKEELVGRSPLPGHLNLWVQRKDRVPFAAALKRAGEVLGAEIEFRRKDGAIRRALLSARILDIPGEPCHIAIIRDITERKEAEKALKKSEERLRALSAHLQSVREEEQANISREIHDDLGQRLTGLKLDLAWLIRHLNPDQSDLKIKVRALGQSIDQTILSVRQISTKLRPRILDDFGLIAALEWQAQEFTGKTGVPCRFRSTVEILDLQADLKVAVFRIFQEALTNVARHSGATRVEASLKTDAQGLVLTIRDNGRGFSEQENVPFKSLGLVGMRERALIFGGTVQIQGQKGKGTTVVLRLPLPQ